MTVATNVERTWYILENKRTFSESLIWEWQRAYFTETGLDAWRDGEVPHYVSSNPTVANAYAEIVFAFWRDQQRLFPGDEPITICELGAGSGRFAFHFLVRFTGLCEEYAMPLNRFRYILSDFTQRNLDFWRNHSSFRRFFDSGLLDIALFDVNSSDRLSLQLSGAQIVPGELNHPLIVFANYVFDSIPSELLYFDNKHCAECLVSLRVDKDPDTLSVAELLKALDYHYDYRDVTAPPYPETYLQRIIELYQGALNDSHILFPVTGLRCLERLRHLSRKGLLLLSTDKGDHDLVRLRNRGVPVLVSHGSFSLSVNFHAVRSYCEQNGGISLFQGHHHSHVDLGCFMIFADAKRYTDTQRAFGRHVRDFSPDDFYTITRHAQKHIAEMSMEEILTYLRLSLYDAHQFARYQPRLLELAPEMDQTQREDVTNALEKVWSLYFPLGEKTDLAFQIATLLYELDDYPRAIAYLERSIEIYGEHTGTLCNLAICYQMMAQYDKAEPLLRKILFANPLNEQARTLLLENGPS